VCSYEIGGNSACMGEIKNGYKILVKKSEAKIILKCILEKWDECGLESSDSG
jgi:hypothetical protein